MARKLLMMLTRIREMISRVSREERGRFQNDCEEGLRGMRRIKMRLAKMTEKTERRMFSER